MLVVLRQPFIKCVALSTLVVVAFASGCFLPSIVWFSFQRIHFTRAHSRTQSILWNGNRIIEYVFSLTNENLIWCRRIRGKHKRTTKLYLLKLVIVEVSHFFFVVIYFLSPHFFHIDFRRSAEFQILWHDSMINNWIFFENFHNAKMNADPRFLRRDNFFVFIFFWFIRIHCLRNEKIHWIR